MSENVLYFLLIFSCLCCHLYNSDTYGNYCVGVSSMGYHGTKTCSFDFFAVLKTRKEDDLSTILLLDRIFQ